MRLFKLMALAILVSWGAVSSASPAVAMPPPERSQSEPPAQVRKFTGTIVRNGDQFVLNDAKTHTFYQLDDQAAASKFEARKVVITGTFDAVQDIIRMQSIAEAIP